MLFDCDCKDALERLGDRPKIFKFNFIPNDYLCFGETLCILSSDSAINTFILKSYIVELLARNDTKVLYLDTYINFTYSRFKNISESLDFDTHINFDKIIYIPVPSPAQLLLILDILSDYLRENRGIRVIAVDQLNFWSKNTFKGKEFNKTLNQCYRELKKLQSQFTLLLVYTKTLKIGKNDLQKIIQSHYHGLADGVDNKNTVVLLTVPMETDFEVFTFRFKRSFNLHFRSCYVKQISCFDSYNNNADYCFIDKFCNDAIDCDEEDGNRCELEKVQQCIFGRS